MIRIGAFFAFCVAFCGAAFAQAPDSLFPLPDSLKPAVDFWTRVYTEVGTNGGFIHDNRRLDIVYESLEFPEKVTSRERRRITSSASDHYREILNTLAGGKRENLSAAETRVLALWPEGVTNKELAAAAGRIRFQLGQADRFRQGLVRSGAWKPHILQVLAARGLPPELAALPHVESSFDPTAYSRVGAAGLWQFTRSTGLRYMQIDHIVDERRDPFLSTYAAARLLEDNYSVIESWPLALTAYNHGLAGMRRAATRLNTRDIATIVDTYDGRAFGFASRNFYAAFLAAKRIDADPKRYFGEIEIDVPGDYAVVEVPDFLTAKTLSSALKISVRELQRLNPALMETVWEGDKFVPKGFELRLPASAGREAQAFLASIPEAERYASQRPDLYHRVSSGETLSGIADRYGVSLAALVRVNNLRSRNFIRVGQTLTLPINGTEIPPTLAQADTATAAMAASGEYIVRRGDSIDRISRSIGVDAAALASYNGLDNRNLIYPGQRLRVPGAADVPEPVEAPSIATLVAAVAADSSRDSGAAVNAILASAPAEADETDEIDDVLVNGDDEEAEAAVASESNANALASVQAELAADPSDYTVASDGTIEVQALETLGHYADWLGIRTQRLRDINGLAFRQAVVIGQRIKLDFSEIDTNAFELRRMAYQKERQESFFLSYRIENTTEHVVRRGESIWVLAQRQYNVPVWLLRQYNPDLNLDRVSPGTVVKFPNLRRNSEQEASVRS